MKGSQGEEEKEENRRGADSVNSTNAPDLEHKHGENNVDSVSASSEREGRCHRLLSKVCCKCFMRLPVTWPRTTSIILQVVLPLWGLIFISWWFGGYLSDLESSGEYDANDDGMAARTQSVTTIEFLDTAAEVLPQICAELYFDDNQTLAELEEDLADMVRTGLTEEFLAQLNQTSSTLNNNTATVNLTDMLEFMEECGELVGNITGPLASRAVDNIADQDSSSLSFSWTRCPGPQSKKCKNVDICDSLGLNRTRFFPSTQQTVFATAWTNNRYALFEVYYNQSLLEGKEPGQAAIEALNMANEEATGRGNCTVNYPSGAWFWFTIMSTIGYGNQAPETTGGRAMIYTLGFASIMAFGAILATSGYVITTIFDDAVGRNKYSELLSTPLAGSLLWGALYYAWMIVIAGYTVYWNEDRLEENFDFKDAFWFAYISTTTVGLGDFYLEPAVLQKEDLTVWPLLFLFGFVLLANFVVKFAELIVSLLPHEKDNHLEERLSNTNVIACCPRKHDERHNEETSSDVNAK